MDVDAVFINALSKEERERHVRNGLCFVCHKDGHMSKECPNRNKYKNKGKKIVESWTKKKKTRFASRRHIRATDMDDSSGEEEEDVAESSQSNDEQTICALLKKLPKDKRINMLINMEQDF